MNRKLIPIAALSAACLLSPSRAGAAEQAGSRNGEMTAPAPAPAKSAALLDPMEEKFRKLQREMESGPSVAAQSGTAKADGMEGPRPSSSISVASLALQILLGLVFVLILAVVTIRLLKRFQGRMISKPGRGGGDLFEVLETCHLGANQKVVALRMNEEVGILGVTQQGISLLSVLKEPAADIRQAHARESNSALFAENLNKLLDRFKKPKRVSDLLDEARE